MKKTLIFLTILMLTASAFAAPADLKLFGQNDVSGTSIIQPDNTRDILIDQQPNQVNGLFSDASWPQVIADNFVLAAEETIAQLVVWGGYYSANIPMEPDYFTVIFHDDDAGSPGTTISTEVDVPYTRVQTGIQLFGVDEWMHTLTLVTPVTLAAGTYWVEFYNTTGYPATDTYFWETGNLDPVNGIVGSAWATTAPGSAWNIDGATDLAFQLISGGPQTIQVDPLAVPYWTGTCTSAAFTDDSEVRGWDTEDGWMMFDVSAIPVGATILEIEFNGYVNATYYPYWEINGVYIDPLTAAPADLFAAVTNSANQYNLFLESSTFSPGWKVDILGGASNADLQAATVQGWFCLGINSTDDYPDYYLIFDGWDEVNPPFLMVTYEGGGAPLGELTGVVSEFGTGTPIEGAEVTIAGSGLSATTLADGSYSIVDIMPDVYDISCAAPLYIAAEEVGFDIVSGANVLDFDLLWSEIETDVTELVSNLLPDETEVQTFTITNNGPGDLEYNISFDLPVEFTVRTFPSITTSVTPREITKTEYTHSKGMEYSPMETHVSGELTDDIWDVQGSFRPIDASGVVSQAGMEFDGTYFYCPVWNSADICKYDIDGNFVETFQVPGVSATRDLAYDGQYMYGGSGASQIFCWDPATYTLITTINSSQGVYRAIAYDSDNDGFLGNNWDGAIVCTARDGSTLYIIPDIGISSLYGMAYDNVSAGGPYLWVFSQAGSGAEIHQVDIASGLPTGVMHNVLADFPSAGIAGGLWTSPDYVMGTLTIGGLVQGEDAFMYELCEVENWVMATNNASGTVPANGGTIVVDVTFDASGLTLGDVLTGDLLIHNNANYTATRGDDYVIPVTLNVGGTTLEVPTNVSVDPDLGLLTWGPPAGVAIYSDDFESYTVGEYLAVQSADWTTWSNSPGGSEDALISDAQALSGSNSVVVEGGTDLVLIMNDYTSGVYSMDLNLFVPTGYCGYWNLQKTSTPGQEWAFQIQFDVTGIASADAGAAAALTFPFNFDTWINMELIVDLDADWCEIWVDGVMLHEYQWTLGTFGTPGLLSFGGMNLYAWASAGNSPQCYFDDIELNEITSDSRDLTGYNVYLDDMGTVLANVGTDVFEYLYSDLVNGEDYIAGVSAVYDAGESDIVEFPFTYTGVSADNIVNITTALKGNYPNPFNPVTNIAFSLGEATHVTLEVYNVKGEKVRTLVDKVLEANNHVITWDGKNNTNKSVASGIYFYKMRAEKYTATKKMILMK